MTAALAASTVRCLTFTIAFAATLVPVVSTQQPGPTAADAPRNPTDGTPVFRTGVRYIEIDVTVRDRRGQFISDLTKDDFFLREDLKPHAVDRVTLVNLPSVQPRDVAQIQFVAAADSGQVMSAGGSPLAGRIYIMVLECATANTVAIARRFIEQYLGDSDRIGVVLGSNHGWNQPLGDREQAMAAMQRLPARTSCSTGRHTYRTLKEVAVNLSAVTGRRKSILYIGDGQDLWTPTPNGLAESWAALNDATRTAAGYRVPIHTVNPRRIRLLPVPEGEFGTRADDLAGGVVGDDRASGLGLLQNQFTSHLRRAPRRRHGLAVRGDSPPRGSR